MNNKKILVILLIFLKKGGRIYSILNISNSKMNKKVIAIILVFLVGIIGGILLSRVGNNAKMKYQIMRVKIQQLMLILLNQKIQHQKMRLVIL